MINYKKLYWCSDWDGEDVGYPEVKIVGIYKLKDFSEISLYIDMESKKILEVWLEEI